MKAPKYMTVQCQGNGNRQGQ